MSFRHGSRRWSVLCCTIGVVVGSVLVVAPAGAALSDDDCDTLIAGQPTSNAAAGSISDTEGLALQADAYKDTAADISDKKLKAGLLRIADVYGEASKEKTTAAASLVLSERAKDYAKGYKVYAKSLNQCMVRSLSSVPTR